MSRKLFLTGPIGCGKSTAIRTALGESISCCGGFLTCRHTQPDYFFTMDSPDGQRSEVFLDFSGGQPRFRREVFANLGRQLMEGKVLVLDEIGGAELLCPEFTEALYHVLSRDIPILGVLKGEAPSAALTQVLGLPEDYTREALRLRETIEALPDTTLYPCGNFDQQALLLAQNWAKEYLHD